MASPLIDIEYDVNQEIEDLKTKIADNKKKLEALKKKANAVKNDKVTAEEVKKDMAFLKADMAQDEKNLKEAKKASQEISKKLSNRRMFLEKRREENTKLLSRVDYAMAKTDILDNLKGARESGDMAKYAALNKRLSILNNILNSAKDTLFKTNIDIIKNNRAFYFEESRRMKFGFESLFNNMGKLWTDYVLISRKLAERYERQKLKMMGQLIVHTGEYILRSFAMGLKVFFKTSEEYFKETMKTWGRRVLDAFAPITGPLMFMAGALGSVWSFLKGNAKNQKAKEIDQPVWTRLFTGIYNNMVLLRKSAETAEAREARLEKKRAREEGRAEKKPIGVGSWAVLGLAFAGLGLIASYVQKALIPFRALGGVLGKLGSFLGKFKGLWKPLDLAFEGFAKVSSILGKGLAAVKGFGIKVVKLFDFTDLTKRFGGFLKMLEKIPLLGKMLSGLGSAVLTKISFFARLFGAGIKAIPVIGWFITVVQAIWDFGKGFMNTEGSLMKKLFGGLREAVKGFLEPFAWLSEKLLGFMGLKPAESLLEKIMRGFDYLFKFEWLKDLLSFLPNVVLKGMGLDNWVRTKSTTNEPQLVKQTNTKLGDSMDNNFRAKVNTSEQRYLVDKEARAETLKALKDIKREGGTASATVVNPGNNTGNNSGPRPSEAAIPTRIAPELAYASFAAIH